MSKKYNYIAFFISFITIAVIILAAVIFHTCIKGG